MSTTSTPSTGLTLEERLASPLEQWEAAFEAFARALRVALPATVVSFKAGPPQTVTVQPSVREATRYGHQTTWLPLTQLVDIPIMLPRGGNYVLTTPIEAGDEVLVILCDTSIDGWLLSGGLQNQFEQRRHTLADAVALVGIWNNTRSISDYSTTSAQLRSLDGTVVVDLAASQITVTAPTVQVNSTNATVSASDTATVEGATVNVTGTSAVNISASANTTIEGRNFLAHTHKNVSTGAGVSGPVL
jgi:phage baseplate assembly protein gpV